MKNSSHGRTTHIIEEGGEILGSNHRGQVNPQETLSAERKFIEARAKLYPLIGRKNALDLCHKSSLIRAIILHIVTYASVAWGHITKSTKGTLQRLENIRLKCAVNAPWYIRNNFILMELEHMSSVFRMSFLS